jgi:DNA-binding NarL/FixJ family response regulator
MFAESPSGRQEPGPSSARSQGGPTRPLGLRHRVLLVDDHTIMRDGLRVLLEGDERLEICGAVDNGREAIRAVGALNPDIILMDLAMPEVDGLSAIRELVRRSCTAKILVLTMHKSEEHIREALQAGASGYLLKDASRAELLMAIQSVLAGRVFISAGIADRIVTAYLDRSRGDAPVQLLSDTLTPREKQVLKLIAEGRRNRDIAETLYVSVKTVEKHRANLMNKLDLHNTAALTTFAIENAIATPT